MPDYALTLSEAELGRYQWMAANARRIEAQFWAEAGIVEGAAVADVGCGPGAIATVTAQIVGPTGRVAAVDQDETAVETATALAAQLGLTNVTFQHGDATATGLEPESFDVVIMRHVLAHNGGREQAIVDHLASLLKPGGCVYLLDVEMTGIRTRPVAPDLDEIGSRYRAFHAGRGNDTSVGLRLGELVQAAGLELVVHRGWYEIGDLPPGFRPPAWAAREAMVAAGVADQADLDRWNAALEWRDAHPSRLTVFIPYLSAIGRRV